MAQAGFWTDGPSEHRRALEAHIEDLRQRLENCSGEERNQLASELDQAVHDLKRAGDIQNLW